MLNSEQIPLAVSELGEGRVEIEEGLGEKIILDLASAKQRLENLQNQKDNFANQASWQKQITAAEKAIAMLEGADGNKEGRGKSTMLNIVNKVRELFRGK